MAAARLTHQYVDTKAGGPRLRAVGLAPSAVISGRICWSVLPVKRGHVLNASTGCGRGTGPQTSTVGLMLNFGKWVCMFLRR